MLPAGRAPVDPPWATARDADPVVQRYRRLFAHVDWSVVPERDPSRPWPGSPPHPTSAYIKALLVKLGEGTPSITGLRRFLLEHPLLVLELGFRPVRDPTQPYGVDVARTVPGERWLRHQQQTVDHGVLQALLERTVGALTGAFPDLGATVAVDVKHIYAWVAENNPKQDGPRRGTARRQPPGDPDCRLGVKWRANQTPGPRGRREKHYLWGYGSGIATATHPGCGDVVLAEWTQPFNRQDVTYFHPVYDQACAHLGRVPTNVAADAAFDAWHVYQTCATTGGIAAIPRNDRTAAPARTPDGRPVCAQGLAMTPGREFEHEDGFPARDHHCPLLRPHRTGAGCDQSQFPNGGCHKVINLAPGGMMRAALDRTSAAYQAVYRQRTSAERINSQATALGIERPKVRRAAAVARLNTLTYLTINVAVLDRMQQRPPPPTPLALC